MVTQPQNGKAKAFSATTTVRNTGAAPLSGWAVTWTFAGDERVTAVQGGTWGQNGQGVRVANLPGNGQLVAGASTQFAVQGAVNHGTDLPTVSCTAF